ncbi:MAG: hypothetical protein R3F41_14445 [Gammaproteobacteria bacterium]|nr:hypothetical protein [Pseudomonadales bacterium]MCP5347177.1 hypothetical protein [Pseudomonadales bacterium]
MSRERLKLFFDTLAVEVIALIGDIDRFARLFPYLAVLRHLRTLPLRRRAVAGGREELREPLITVPLSHCQWLLNHHTEVSAWVQDSLD